MEEKRKWKHGKSSNSSSIPVPNSSSIHNLDDGCLMHIFSFLSPIPDAFVLDTAVASTFSERCCCPCIYDIIPSLSSIAIEFADRYNTALVCHRWHYLACHPRLWLRVDRFVKDSSDPGVFPSIEMAVSAARPGDTILIAAGGSHLASNIQIKKPLCLIGGGELPDETTLLCSRGSDSALEFMSTCKVANLTVKAELGCCLLHRSGRLTIDGCILQCESNPLDYLSCPIVSTAAGAEILTSSVKSHGDSVSVSRTRIEGGAKAVLTSGSLELQRVRVIYARTSIFFWFDVDRK